MTDLFPRGVDTSKAEFWCGLRPMTPDGAPVVGPTPFRNPFLNTGHGTLGWTMACGSGRVLADMVSGRQPEIGLEGLFMDCCVCRSESFAIPNGATGQGASAATPAHAIHKAADKYTGIQTQKA